MAASIIEPSAPTDADSVGVATPAKIENRARERLSVRGGIIANRARLIDPFFSASGTISPGAMSLFKRNCSGPKKTKKD